MPKAHTSVAPRPDTRAHTRRWLMGVVGVGLSVAGLWYVFSGLKLDDFAGSLSRVRIGPLVASLAAYWLGLVAVRALLVRHLLRPVGGIPIAKAYKYILVGFLANNILPMKAGEIARSGGISRVTGIRFSTVLGSLIVERMLDVVLLGVVSLVAIQVAPMPRSLQLAALVCAGLVTIAFIAFIIVARRSWSERDPESGTRVKVMLWNLWVRVMAGLRSLGTAKGATIAVLLSAAAWIFITASYLLRLIAFDMPPNVGMVLVLLACIGFASILPSTPSNLGVVHAAIVFALTSLGVDKATAVGFAVFCHLTDVIPGSLFGALALVLEGVTWKDFRRSSQVAYQRSE